MSKFIYEKIHKEEEHKLTEKTFRTRMITSVLCMIACMVAMLSSAFAWFTVDISSDMAVISAANYSIEVTVKDNSGNQEIVSQTVKGSENGVGNYRYTCPLVEDSLHSFEVKATGTAKTGYCQILISQTIDGSVKTTQYKTYPIAQGKKLDVRIQAAEGCVIEFCPAWGSLENTAVTFSLRRPQTFYIDHSATPYIEYLVVEGVTLEALAEYYGVSVEDICIYNGISELEVGETIKIPGIEDDSIEPYMPPQAGVATPSNATPSDAMQQTGAEQATEGASATESSAAAESTPAVESSAAPESTPSAESSAAIESTSAVESSAATESTSETESSAVAESTQAVESSAATESTSVAETTIATESTLTPEPTSATQSESVIFTAPDPTSSGAASSGEEPADPSIPPEMPTEDIEAMNETEAAKPGTETEATSEPS